MFDEEGDQDAVSNALRSRRMPHGRSRNNARTGVYDLKYGSTKSKKHGDESERASVSTFTIHGLSPEETGLIATLSIGDLLIGMSVLAGSRRDLNKIVAELEKGDLDEEPIDESEGEEEEDDEHDTVEAEPKSAMEEEDERINRRAKAFEKNSFRNPKFWMRWRAHVRSSNGEEVNETNGGYIVFSGNDCATFEGTISSEVLGWDNMRLNGHKVKPHTGECPVQWRDFD